MNNMLRLGARASCLAGRWAGASFYARPRGLQHSSACVRRWYSTEQDAPPTNTPSSSFDSTLDDILSAIKSTAPGATRSEVGLPVEPTATTTTSQPWEEWDEDEYDDGSEPRGDEQFTTAIYDYLVEAYPTLKHTNQPLVKAAVLKENYADIYLHNHTHEPKKVIKFQDIVTKNYRTIARSWPMVRLDNFKYGNGHYIDELYDNIRGMYKWNNQLAYPDGSINLFCGTSSKAAPLNVKGDSSAFTYDDGLYKLVDGMPVRLSISTEEAASRFPLYSKKQRDEVKVVPNPEYETSSEHYERINWETSQVRKRRWVDLTHQGRKEDDRIVYDPVTMVKLVSHTTDGKMIERYYYRDELNEDNTILESVGDGDDLEPNFNPKTGVVEEVRAYGYKDPELATSSVDGSDILYPNYRPTLERVADKALNEVLPLRNSTGKPTKIEYKRDLNTNLFDEDVLPQEMQEDMVASFNELVEEGQLKQEDELQYYNDYVRLAAKALKKVRAEEYRKNEILDQGLKLSEADGMWRVEPIYYFKYIKLNLAEGWIRFYMGEQNRNDESTGLGNELVVDTLRAFKTTDLPFVWKYPTSTKPQHSWQDLNAMRAVKWPPSLVPPPQNPMQRGDGSPQDQLAEYFEKSYLRFGHQVRFDQDNCYSKEHDLLEPPEQKFQKAFSFAQKIERYTDPLFTSEEVATLEGGVTPEVTPEDGATPEEGVTPEELAEVENVIREAIDGRAQFLNEEQAEEAQFEFYEDLKDQKEDSQDVQDADRDLYLKALKELPGLPDPETARPKPAVHISRRIVQKHDSVLAYDASGSHVIQEYVGYRLRVNGNKFRIIRTQQDASIRFFDDKGEVIQTENHSGPLIYNHRPRIQYNLDEDDDEWSTPAELLEDATDDVFAVLEENLESEADQLEETDKPEETDNSEEKPEDKPEETDNSEEKPEETDKPEATDKSEEKDVPKPQ